MYKNAYITIICIKNILLDFISQLLEGMNYTIVQINCLFTIPKSVVFRKFYIQPTPSESIKLSLGLVFAH